MATIFFKDILDGQEITYDQLLDDLRSTTIFNKYCKSNNYYTIFKSIVLSLLLGKEIILLDDDFTEDELIRLIGANTDDNGIITIDEIFRDTIPTLNALLSKLIRPDKEWKITLFTSGTTGIPKKITHDFETISRNVRRTEKHNNSVWGFAYNPSHMAGIQVFFQALLNQNTIIRLFKLNRESILDLIISEKITHISATPTFYRLLLPTDRICESVLSLTSGGEKFDEKSLMLLRQMFPKAKLTNVYASTEAGTVLASSGDYFEIKEQFKNLVKIENDELYLHTSIMGKSESLEIQGEVWYATGDVVEIQSENPIKFRFVNRKNEMINVGGYKVNPGEIEDTLLAIDGILQVRVFAKKNALLGNVICAEVVCSDKSITESQLRLTLQKKLQEFKIPRIIKFVDNLKITRTGKIQRD